MIDPIFHRFCDRSLIFRMQRMHAASEQEKKAQRVLDFARAYGMGSKKQLSLKLLVHEEQAIQEALVMSFQVNT